jgi:hypothetical protein
MGLRRDHSRAVRRVRVMNSKAPPIPSSIGAVVVSMFRLRNLLGLLKNGIVRLNRFEPFIELLNLFMLLVVESMMRSLWGVHYRIVVSVSV